VWGIEGEVSTRRNDGRLDVGRMWLCVKVSVGKLEERVLLARRIGDGDGSCKNGHLDRHGRSVDQTIIPIAGDGVGKRGIKSKTMILTA
jgi:hypothetical protein